MNEFDLTYAELQFVWDHEVGDHSAEEIKKIDQICRTTASYQLPIAPHFCGDEHRKSPR